MVLCSATNARFFSYWYGVMSSFSSLNDGYIFFDAASPSERLLPTSYDGVVGDVGGTPTCRNTPNSGTCSVSIDMTAFVPCVNIQNTVWPVCQKPTASSIYPAYPASDPTSDNGQFP